LRAFQCSTGAARWTWRTPGSITSHVVTSAVTSASPSVLVSAPDRAVLLDARSGAVRWSRPLATDALATIDGARSEAAVVPIFGSPSIVSFAPATGAPRAPTPSAPHRRIAWQPDGSFRTIDAEVPGETGGPSAPIPAHEPAVHVDRGPGQSPAHI